MRPLENGLENGWFYLLDSPPTLVEKRPRPRKLARFRNDDSNPRSGGGGGMAEGFASLRANRSQTKLDESSSFRAPETPRDSKLPRETDNCAMRVLFVQRNRFKAICSSLWKEREERALDTWRVARGGRKFTLKPCNFETFIFIDIIA